ncbi:mucin-2-like isoform X1 [Ptychodera flava]|uniref:mucin-2-like isoform X1 n=1 Tax=Ptychodera flava TaxID=63121 RepID=UPI00396A69A1
MFVEKDGECVYLSSLPCERDGVEHEAGAEIKHGCGKCTCTDGVWDCVDMACPTKPACGAREEYVECKSPCPKTCENKDSYDGCTAAICEGGCQCKEEFVFDGEKCIRPSKCHCYHGGEKHKDGTVLEDDCNRCTCNGGTWSCEDIDCSGLCHVYGDPHYQTYDGKMYDFQGECDYILSQSTTNNENYFRVTVKNIKCGTSGVTCTRDIRIKIGRGDDKTIVLLKRGKEPSVTHTGSGHNVEIVELQIYTVVYTDVGMYVKWNRGTTVYVVVDGRHRNKLEGLCGNFNGPQKDDFTCPGGGFPVESETEFGNCWRANDCCPDAPTIEDPCELHPDRKTWAKKSCSVIKSDLFIPCHSLVPYKPFLRRCEYDACGCDMGGDCECLCTAVAAYAAECSRHGVHIRWRSQELCPIQCEECMVYDPCISPCKDTCAGRDGDNCEDLCVEGCRCPDDQVWDGEKCVAECPAEPTTVAPTTMAPTTEAPETPEPTTVTEAPTTEEPTTEPPTTLPPTTTDAPTTPEPTTAPPKPPCLCHGFGDPHYQSFDGLWFSHQGNCTYLLARPQDIHDFEVFVNNVPCVEQPTTTCTKEVIVVYGSYEVVLKGDNKVLVNGELADLPANVDDVIYVNQAGLQLVLTIPEIGVDFEVRFESIFHTYSVLVPSSLYWDRTEGICGPCNGDTSDDFRMRDGTISDDVEDFVQDWFVPERSHDDCPPPTQSPPCEPPLDICVEKCGVLLSDTFEECRDRIDPGHYFEKCLYDCCHCATPGGCYCDSISAYAMLCSYGNICIDWRDDDLCPIECPEDMYYTECGKACNTTLDNCNLPDELLCSKFPAPGCFCHDGYVQTDDGCKPCPEESGSGSEEEPTTEAPTTAEPTTPEPEDSGSGSGEEPTTAEPTTAEPTTAEPTTTEPEDSGSGSGEEPTTAEPTTAEPTTAEPTTPEPEDSGSGSGEEPTTPAPTTEAPCVTVDPSVCERFLDIFEGCDDALDFYDQCRNTCEDDVCDFFEEYANRCKSQGICVEWRNEEFCPTECPNGLEYMECGASCNNTCRDDCPSTTEPGCYCPSGTFAKNGNCCPCCVAEVGCPEAPEEPTCPPGQELRSRTDRSGCCPQTLYYCTCPVHCPLPPECPDGMELEVMGKGVCCPIYKCKQRCQAVSTKPRIIEIDGCKAIHPIILNECQGGCQSGSVYSLESNDIINSCTCCRATQSKAKMVLLLCKGGGKRYYTYERITECQCLPCEPEDIVTTPEPTTAPQTTPAQTTQAPTTLEPTTVLPTTLLPTTEGETTAAPTTALPSTAGPTTAAPTTAATTEPEDSGSGSGEEPTTAAPTTVVPTTAVPTTEAPTTAAPTTVGPTEPEESGSGSREEPTTVAQTTVAPTTAVQPTEAPTTAVPTTEAPTEPEDSGSGSGEEPTTAAPTTAAPTTAVPTTEAPTTAARTTEAPTEPEDSGSGSGEEPTTAAPTTAAPTTAVLTTEAPTTAAPTTEGPTEPEDSGSGSGEEPTTAAPTSAVPTTAGPTTGAPTTAAPTTEGPTEPEDSGSGSGEEPTTAAPTTAAPTTAAPTTAAPTTAGPTTRAPTTAAPTTEAPTEPEDSGSGSGDEPTTSAPTTAAPTTAAPTTDAPTTAAPTTEAPTEPEDSGSGSGEEPTTAAPTTVAPTTAAPTTEAPTTPGPTSCIPVDPSVCDRFLELFEDCDDASNYYDQCLRLCEDQLCDFFEEYANHCKGRGICVEWRNEELCPVECPNELEYMDCGPICNNTCNEDCNYVLQPGCYCQEGTYAKDGDCQPCPVPTTEAPTTEAPTEPEDSGSGSGEEPTTAAPTTAAPTTAAPTTAGPTTEAPTTAAPTTEAPTEPEDSGSGSGEEPTTAAPTTAAPTTAAPTTAGPTTRAPTTAAPTTEAPTEPEDSGSGSGEEPTTAAPTTAAPTTAAPTTAGPTTEAPTEPEDSGSGSGEEPTTAAPTTAAPTTAVVPTTAAPTTAAPTTEAPTEPEDSGSGSGEEPTTAAPTTAAPTTAVPTTAAPTTAAPTTAAPTTEAATTPGPTSCIPVNPSVCDRFLELFEDCDDASNYYDQCLGLCEDQLCDFFEEYANHCKGQGICVEWRNEELCPVECPNELEYMDCGPVCNNTCNKDCNYVLQPGCYCPEGTYAKDGDCQPCQGPTTEAPTTAAPSTEAPTTEAPTTEAPTTEAPTTEAPTTKAPTTEAPTTEAPTTEAPTTEAPTTKAPTTEAPTTEAPTTEAPTTEAPTTEAPTTEAPTTEAPTTEAPTTEAPTTEAPTTKAPTTEAPTTEAPTTEAPTTEAPTTTECIREEWSEWMDDEFGGKVDHLADGEFELYDDLREHFEFCENPIDIECRLAKSPYPPYDQTGQRELSCDVEEGFRCYHSDQMPPLCYNYEIRVLCEVPCDDEQTNSPTTCPPSEKTTEPPEGTQAPTTIPQTSQQPSTQYTTLPPTTQAQTTLPPPTTDEQATLAPTTAPPATTVEPTTTIAATTEKCVTSSEEPGGCSGPGCPSSESSNESGCKGKDCPSSESSNESGCKGKDCPSSESSNESGCKGKDCPSSESSNESGCKGKDCPSSESSNESGCKGKDCPSSESSNESGCKGKDCPPSGSSESEECKGPECNKSSKQSSEESGSRSSGGKSGKSGAKSSKGSGSKSSGGKGSKSGGNSSKGKGSGSSGGNSGKSGSKSRRRGGKSKRSTF